MRSEAAFAPSVRGGANPGQQRQDPPAPAQPRRRPRREHALYTVVLTRLRLDERTRRYVARRTTEGLSRREIIHCLQRYVARELYRALVSLPPSSS
jgi:hypothetical protein